MAITSRYPLTKTTGEIFQVNMDFSQVLNSGATIGSATVLYIPNDLTLSLTNITAISSGVSLIVASGTQNTNYRIQITAITSDLETLVGEGILKVRSI